MNWKKFNKIITLLVSLLIVAVFSFEISHYIDSYKNSPNYKSHHQSQTQSSPIKQNYNSNNLYFVATNNSMIAVPQSAKNSDWSNIYLNTQSVVRFNLNQPASKSDKLIENFTQAFHVIAPIQVGDTIQFCSNNTSIIINLYIYTNQYGVYEVNGVKKCS